MSYKTNPIFNRIKINKGWKNPYLPTKTLNYSRDISLWFKVYLLLKFFLNLKKIQLVSFEIRFDQKNKKIIYLRINKKGEQKKKRKKKKLAFNKILKKIQTPMLKSRNTGAIFFLYKDALALKKLTFWNKNVIQKKVLTRYWLTKPKISTWLNTLEKITLLRKKTKKNLQYAKKNKDFLPTAYLKWKFANNKQKQLLTQIAKLKKKNLILSVQFFALLPQKKVLRKFTQNLKKEIFRNKIQIQKISQVYNFLLLSLKKKSLEKKLKRNFLKKKITNSLQRQKLNLFWKILKKQLNSLSRVRFLRKELPVLLLNAKTKLDKPLYKYQSNFLKNKTLLKKILHLNFLVGQLSNNVFLLKNSFLLHRFYLKSKLQIPTAKSAKLSEKNLLASSFFKRNLNKNKKENLRKKQLSAKLSYNISLWIALRKVKKRKVKGLHARSFRRKFKRFQKNLYTKLKLKSYTQYNNFLAKNKFFRKRKQNQIGQQIKNINWSLKRYRIAKYYQYRLPYRQMHFIFQQFETNLKLKYLIQDFVQKYFSVQVETKIVHVLNSQKNMNFFRLIFSIRKKKHNLLVKKRRLDTWNQKEIFLASRLQFLTSAKKKKRKAKKLIPLNTSLTKKNAIKVLEKKTLFLLSEKKRLKWRMKNYFSRIKQSKDFRSVFKYLMPTLIDFSRSLDPQLLANVLTKVIKTSKKQTWMMNTIKSILQALQLPKNVGYKILLSGRINSKKKSRSIYIAQKQIALQVFSNNMNFAYAQANARIGAFGVKIWIYSKKN